MDAQKRKNIFLAYILGSVFLHILLVAGFSFAPLGQKVPPVPTVFIDLDPLSSQKELLQQSQNKKMQIVETESVPSDLARDDAKYLSEKDQMVKDETRAKAVDTFRTGGRTTRAGKPGKIIGLKDIVPTTKEVTPPTKEEMDGYYRQKKQVVQVQRGEGDGAEESDLGSASSDYLLDVKEGDKTLLNTKQFVYFGYYKRIRERLEVAWNNELRTTLNTYIYGGRSLASERNYVTGVVVVLDREGKIVRVKLLKRSGAFDLDQAAVDAFNKAGPFPNPPSGLVDENGEIQIHWDFILQS
ncbi:MAG: energy transducer TonB [Oligoflexia bacterium]|nr:energy transducer TonB [Oligoflexia bacterium]